MNARFFDLLPRSSARQVQGASAATHNPLFYKSETKMPKICGRAKNIPEAEERRKTFIF